eukprot:TRINITY_DN14234_c0_g1_i4.p1 TRINITY_DN14234_c0_g1~~TRINITY_DN14234_c0_g1_i4.p1  ORF type:complete len:340 (-),score=57.18 TRINITY_DN14234_c0_g1_i4:30-1049(-)
MARFFSQNRKLLSSLLFRSPLRNVLLPHARSLSTRNLLKPVGPSYLTKALFTSTIRQISHLSRPVSPLPRWNRKSTIASQFFSPLGLQGSTRSFSAFRKFVRTTGSIFSFLFRVARSYPNLTFRIIGAITLGFVLLWLVFKFLKIFLLLFLFMGGLWYFLQRAETRRVEAERNAHPMTRFSRSIPRSFRVKPGLPNPLVLPFFFVGQFVTNFLLKNLNQKSDQLMETLEEVQQRVKRDARVQKLLGREIDFEWPRSLDFNEKDSRKSLRAELQAHGSNQSARVMVERTEESSDPASQRFPTLSFKSKTLMKITIEAEDGKQIVIEEDDDYIDADEVNNK